MSNAATESVRDDLQEVLRLGQKCLETVPVVVVGSGASAALGLRGMGPLAEYLIEKISPLTGEEVLWDAFKSSLKTTADLERALQDVSLNDRLIEQVIHFTREMVVTDDLLLFEKLVQQEATLPLSRLFSHLFRSTHDTISVVTTNYDRVAEYAADFCQQRFNDGFTDGHYRHFGSTTTRSRDSGARRQRCVDVWKVHGSVDWFRGPGQAPFALPHRQSYPASYKPLLVTPGVSKYFMTHQEPFRTIITQADDALSSARGFLCVGYGFADFHIEPKLIQRASNHKPPIVILARTLRQGAKAFLKSCAHDKVLALEKAGDGTRAYTKISPDGVLLTVPNLWDLDGFLTAVGISV